MDHRRAVAQQRVLDGGADVTQDGARATGHDGGEQMRSARGRWMTHRIDPAMKEVEPAGGEAVTDLAARQPRVDQLGVGDEPVLALGQPGQHPINNPYGSARSASSASSAAAPRGTTTTGTGE